MRLLRRLLRGLPRLMILTVSVEDDFHTHVIRDAAVRRGFRDFHVLECDRISGRPGLTWRSHGDASSTVLTSEGRTIPLDAVSVLWWRRMRANQQASARASSDHQQRLVDNDSRGALGGVLAASFRGQWISTPEATDRAADKLYQLSVAREAGFRVPRTLVSQSRDEVAEFARTVDRVIVKPVVGATGPLMFTQYIDDPQAIPEESFSVCPAVYQEYIPGRRHVRLNCFGEQMYAALIESDRLDWRPDLNVPISRWEVPPDVGSRVVEVLRRLGLRMGAIDLKLTPDGEPVWLEVNPQGQFLFLQPLLGEPLDDHFLDFLLSCASAGGPDR
ncbi:RimK family alpha-L-glutamate ligase [Streptomyces sp. NBC_00199]|uniref:ATP-grasp domain-containing protein n=1 Tax=Streptomyces sp. NBC_00199 TaxID=2975678 RepID=UPI002259E72C|nr:ATP-grasp domain-containing protein [Streptomyces sp. NBC_00199]